MRCAASPAGCAGTATSCRSWRTSRRSSSAISRGSATGCAATAFDPGEVDRVRLAAWCAGPHRLPDGGRLHAPAAGHRLAELPHARDAGQLCGLPPVAALAPTGLFLARQFLDFEPGIHWSQMQMQSGTTGINTLRIYSPAKQARTRTRPATTCAAGCRSSARRLPGADRGRARSRGRDQGTPAPTAADCPSPCRGRRPPAAPRLAPQRPAINGEASAAATTSGALTAAIACFIVRVMKGPAYVADGYTLPQQRLGAD
jgi:hypothetical protein